MDDRAGRALDRAALSFFLLGVGLLTLAGSAGATERVLEITEDEAQPTESWNTFDTDPLESHDFDADGTQEIVALNDNDWVYVFDSRSGELLFEAETTVPDHWSARSFNGPVAAEVDEAGTTKLVVANSAAVVTSFRFDPDASSSSSFEFEREWERRLNACHEDPGMDAKPVLADLDQDGEHEILAATEEVGLYVLNQDGSTFWKNCIGGGNGPPAIADLDQDGGPDVVFANDAGLVVAYEGRSGEWMWGYDVSSHYDLGPASIPKTPGIGQLDGTGGPDVVVGARDAHDPDSWDDNHVRFVAIDQDGQELWSFQDPEGNPLTYTTPVVEDADQDGHNEVYLADWNTVGHKPPTGDDAWKRSGPAHFYRLDSDGDLVWRQTIDTWWQNKDIPIADVDGDGQQEVLATGPNADKSQDGVWVLDATTGEREDWHTAYPWKVQRAPVLGDLWGQGTMQWAMAAAPQTADAGGHAILVYDTGQAYDATWPSVPEYPLGSAGSSSSDAGGSFDATFRISSPNEWWQELYVDPDDDSRAITAADVRVDDGSWRPMDESGWGAWTASYHAPQGSEVEFRAHDGSGGTSLSEAFTWMSGETTKRSRDSTDAETAPSGDFEPQFRPGEGSNDWWVEAYVDSEHSVESVQVRINGDDWQPLELKDWGAWASSYHAPEGSEVEFRATSGSGETARSQAFAWLSEDGSDDDFDPDFEPGDDVNEWWIEVSLRSKHSIHAVDVSIDESDWRPLERKDWGAWAKSYHAPEGSEVEFRATSGSGDVAFSDTFTWP